MFHRNRKLYLAHQVQNGLGFEARAIIGSKSVCHTKANFMNDCQNGTFVSKDRKHLPKIIIFCSFSLYFFVDILTKARNRSKITNKSKNNTHTPIKMTSVLNPYEHFGKADEPPNRLFGLAPLGFICSNFLSVSTVVISVITLNVVVTIIQ
jgi:hypothetical protein